jgi:hypothetical protein
MCSRTKRTMIDKDNWIFWGITRNRGFGQQRKKSNFVQYVSLLGNDEISWLVLGKRISDERMSHEIVNWWQRQFPRELLYFAKKQFRKKNSRIEV